MCRTICTSSRYLGEPSSGRAGHEIVGVATRGKGVATFRRDRLAFRCGSSCCNFRFCRIDRENLATGALHRLSDRRRLAEYAVADARYCLPLPAILGLESRALAVRRLIGHRRTAWRRRATLGLYGFERGPYRAQVAAWDGAKLRRHAFRRSERKAGARLGRWWAGASDEAPPEPLDAAISLCARWEPRPRGASRLDRAAPSSAPDHMSDIPSFPYALLCRASFAGGHLTRKGRGGVSSPSRRGPGETQCGPSARRANPRARDLRDGGSGRGSIDGALPDRKDSPQSTATEKQGRRPRPPQ